MFPGAELYPHECDPDSSDDEEDEEDEDLEVNEEEEDREADREAVSDPPSLEPGVADAPQLVPEEDHLMFADSAARGVRVDSAAEQEHHVPGSSNLTE